MENNSLRLSRTPILAGTPTSATGESLTITIPDFEPNRRKATGSPARPQQRREGGVTPPDITAGILEAGRQAQQQAQQRREAINTRAATNPDATTAPALLITKEYLGHAKAGKPAPEQQKTPKKTPPKNAKHENELAQERLERWAMLDAARVLLAGLHGTSMCYRAIRPKTEGVDVHHTTREDGTTRARFGNLITCGSVWACPICAGKIAAQRAAEVDHALKQHRAEGGRLMFLTLTHQHSRDGKLLEQLAKQSAALKLMQEGRRYKELCQQNGVLGMIRGLEMTHSDANGWHVHLHFLVLIAGNDQQAQRHVDALTALDTKRAESIKKGGRTPRQKHNRQPVEIPKARQLPRFGADLVTQWQKAAKKAGLYAHRDAQKAVIASDDDSSLEELARYLTKCEWDEETRKYRSTGEDNPDAFGGHAAHNAAREMVEQAGGKQHRACSAALEITSAHTKKSSRTPLGMLRTYTLERIPKADTPERRAADRKARRMGALYVEYVQATRGKNALVWGAGLKAMYAVQDVDDQDAAEKVDENTALDVVLLTLTPDDWRRVLQAARGTRGKLLETAREGNPDRVRQFVAELKHSREQDEIEKREQDALKRRFLKNQKPLQAAGPTTSDTGRV